MRKLFNFNENITIYVFDKKENLINNSIKSKVYGEEVYINHYTLGENNSLKKVFTGEHDILIREELNKDHKTLLVDVYILEELYGKFDFTAICDLLSKRILRMAG